MKKILIGTLAVCSLAASSMALQFDLLATRVAPGTQLSDMSATLQFAIDGTPIGARPATLVAGPDGSPLKYHFVFNYDDEFLPLQDCDTGPCSSVTYSLLSLSVCGNSATRTYNNLEYSSVVAFPTNLPSTFGPGNQPFPPCLQCEPACAISGDTYLVATNANPNPCGTFVITNTGGPVAPCDITVDIAANCPGFTVAPMGIFVIPMGGSLSVNWCYAGGSDMLPGGHYMCDVLTNALCPVVLTVDDEVAALETPAVFSLAEAFPNPFNPTTTIAYSVPETQKVTLNVFNTNGQLVQTLVNGMVERGEHKVVFDAANLSSGVYVYSLQAGTQSSLKKMVLVK